MNTIKVEIKSVFGNEKIYPACPVVEGFCKLINQKTVVHHCFCNFPVAGGPTAAGVARL